MNPSVSILVFLLILCGMASGWLYKRNRQMARQVQQQLQETARQAEVFNGRNERYRALLRQSTDGIIVLDAENWRIQEANDQFRHIMGFEEAEVVWLHIKDLAISADIVADLEAALATGESRSQRHFRRKDGHGITVEFSATQISYSDKQAIVATFRDITEYVRLQEALKRDIKTAGQVQRSLLPADLDTGQVSVRTIFEPHHMVSGDFFHYTFIKGGHVLAGYMIDVSGHGLGTALQTAALNVLMQEAYLLEVPLIDKVRWINQTVMRYFTEETFAAMLCFELDFDSKILTLVPAGITGFFAASGAHHGLLKTGGSLLGIIPELDITEFLLPVKPGDTFYFVTDGILDLVEVNGFPDNMDLWDFDRTANWFNQLIKTSRRWDDASGLFIKLS
ncbi:PP2C family protein-serine/threonine phosphatase [Sporomusa sp.]|uniref:PP2C family protein-serine/threonine phosphatase n=1 Tax=Sporomusa sp. TaxID=2078658 RepID=UPI002CE3BC8D|nr:SpoIIE family protein phosphatase [Sporomusa sp.]HWR42570.1 SpoIIE family protein phosphatase [Sporomusa sp.]